MYEIVNKSTKKKVYLSISITLAVVTMKSCLDRLQAAVGDTGSWSRNCGICFLFLTILFGCYGGNCFHLNKCESKIHTF